MPEGDDDLLGGRDPISESGGGGDEELSAFESSFPAIDVRNNVGNLLSLKWLF